MSDTRHHRRQKYQHCGEDYGARYNCDKGYGTAYGKDGRQKAKEERRNESKKIIKKELNEL